MDKLDLFTQHLKDSISCAEKECSIIAEGGISEWSNNHLQNVVLPELNMLLSYALKGIIYFKHGKKQRMLESAYLLTDSFQNRGASDLGASLSKLQKIYYSL